MPSPEPRVLGVWTATCFKELIRWASEALTNACFMCGTRRGLTSRTCVVGTRRGHASWAHVVGSVAGHWEDLCIGIRFIWGGQSRRQRCRH